MFSILYPAVIATSLVAVFPTLTGVYVVCLIVGGGLLIISTVFGGHHGDVSVDGAPDMGHDVHLGHASAGHAYGLALTDWFSIQFLVYFSAMFGLVGTALTYTTGLSGGWILLVSLVGGFVIGQGAHQVLRWLWRTSGNSLVNRGDFTQMLARVSVAIKPPSRGQVAVRVRDSERFVTAVAKRSDDQFKVGETVGIVEFANGMAKVVSQKEFEFTSGKVSGANT